ncbi:hypothetical protein IEQ34_015854 [Dendrobium chrysotoxum]|uniref:HMA domain-containing protein n=1 Tax=Dendrobium chrysotoxum TaxID=161865 RepID=A0AAV7GK37_DENCH|nr:hypothetical protein IEQ34_015854 [Dendrobium chrysotoxum]
MGYLSSLLPCGYSHKKRKKAFQTVELKVRMDCDGCEHKTCLIVAGVRSVEINRKQNKVTVTGYVEPNRVVKRVQSTGKKAEIWPYVPYNLVTNPYVTGTYDKKAPPGYVRKGEATQVPSLAIREEDQFTKLFSDDNPNACSIMQISQGKEAPNPWTATRDVQQQQGVTKSMKTNLGNVRKQIRGGEFKREGAGGRVAWPWVVVEGGGLVGVVALRWGSPWPAACREQGKILSNHRVMFIGAEAVISRDSCSNPALDRCSPLPLKASVSAALSTCEYSLSLRSCPVR